MPPSACAAPARRWTLWGGSVEARFVTSATALVREAADSLWCLQLDGLNRFWLTIDHKFCISFARVRLFSRDEAIETMQVPEVAALRPVAIPAEPLLRDMRLILDRVGRPDELTALRIKVAELTAANDRLARAVMETRASTDPDFDNFSAFEAQDESDD
ncbi:hypothetical protein OV203_02575 [Nannocystis sp. ILAH1]|uniref:hypothetical protein n=1 Tax=Nannocystis sp. ILAH1 TaxID=2996789 RepID=UPI00226DA096|nr:hypothetical protein [Nannocystis sp. ILAH1]MCY0985997.1 hypothetical protein [Nannocystis sp. ILAH1]